ncbi:MAG: ParB N-terminal domain-containing protein [Candidatus Bathyarchaeota archaeon]|nr:ParB N-terminal domain-containing protein [Candidatus Bathyarchaeota archaeon]
MLIPNQHAEKQGTQTMPHKSGEVTSLTLDNIGVSIVEISRLKGHERTDEVRLRNLRDEIKSDGMLMRPIVVDEKTNVILDGHHRIKALSLLGCSRIPVCYVNYNSERIGVLCMNKDLEITKSKVIEAALKDEPFPPKSTWHYITSSKTLNHVSYIQRRVDIPLTDLK